MNKACRISVIIPTVNGSQLLEDALRSILQQSIPLNEYEVIVVDQSEDDKTKKLIEKLNRVSGSRIVYHHEKSPGLHAGRNTGARLAKSDILLYCDDDIIASHNWIEEILKCYDFPNTGAAGGKIIGKWENEPQKWIRYFGKDLKNIFPLSLLDLETLLGCQDEIIKLSKGQTYIFGCNFSVRKELIFRMGGTPPDLYLGKMKYLNGDGEVGALRKIQNYGYDLLYNPRAYIHHKVTANRNTLKYFVKRFEDEAYRSIYTVFKESNGSRQALLKYLATTFVSLLLYMVSFLRLLLVENKAKRTYYYVILRHRTKELTHGTRVLFDRKLQKHILQKNHM